VHDFIKDGVQPFMSFKIPTESITEEFGTGNGPVVRRKGRLKVIEILRLINQLT